MFKIIELAFTGYPVTDLKRARAFYEGVLGLRPSHIFGNEETGWVEYDVANGTISIGNGAPEWKPSPGGGCAGLEVEDFDQALRSLQTSGAKHTPEMVTPVCRMTVVSDPDGNSLVLHKRNPANQLPQT